MINILVKAMINIVIPMAGLGSRFASVGYDKAKPFIDVAGKPMIIRVLESLRYSKAKYILVVREEHLKDEPEIINTIKNNFNVSFVSVSELTDGTARTVMLAKEYINNDEPLMIANSDQILDINISDFINSSIEKKLDGSIITFIDSNKDPKWSFAKIDKSGLVEEVREKEAISEYATVGVYYYGKGRYFVDAATDMFLANDKVNNEFYTCPTYNYLINNNQRVEIYNIDASKMHGLGTPEDLEMYKKYVLSA